MSMRSMLFNHVLAILAAEMLWFGLFLEYRPPQSDIDRLM